MAARVSQILRLDLRPAAPRIGPSVSHIHNFSIVVRDIRARDGVIAIEQVTSVIGHRFVVAFDRQRIVVAVAER
jgi:hypothetical protein